MVQIDKQQFAQAVQGPMGALQGVSQEQAAEYVRDVLVNLQSAGVTSIEQAVFAARRHAGEDVQPPEGVDSDPAAGRPVPEGEQADGGSEAAAGEGGAGGQPAGAAVGGDGAGGTRVQSAAAG